MKRLWLSLSLALVGLLAAGWFAIDRALDRWENGEWPAGLGRMSDVPKHFVERRMNDGTHRIIVSMAALHSDLDSAAVRESSSKYLKEQLGRNDLAIDEPPAVLSELLKRRSVELDALRGRILNEGEFVWQSSIRQYPLSPLEVSSTLTIFAVRALVSARRKDAAGWDDLHAMWIVSKGLWQSPSTPFLALKATCLMNGVAMKMPQPEPDWLAELNAIDYRRAFAYSTQVGMWEERRSLAASDRSHEWRRALRAPLVAISFANSAETVRLRTAELYASKACDLAAVPSHIRVAKWNVLGEVESGWISPFWVSLARFQAEREARERFATLRSGRTPAASSRCSDGNWIIDDHSVRFSRTINVTSGTNYPLTLTLR